MTFSVRKALEDSDLPPFEFEDADGETQQLPHMRMLTPRQGLDIVVHGEIERVLTDVAPGAVSTVMDLPSFAVEALIQAWMEHSDISVGDEPGKLPASSGSSRSTPRPSKRTSRSGGSRSRS